jgi:hypothetical protein
VGEKKERGKERPKQADKEGGRKVAKHVKDSLARAHAAMHTGDASA